MLLDWIPLIKKIQPNLSSRLAWPAIANRKELYYIEDIFQATVKEATVNTIVVAEIACWFFIGECIGKGSLVGYQV